MGKDKNEETKVATEKPVNPQAIELWRVRNVADVPTIKPDVPYVKANGQTGYTNLEKLIEKFNAIPDAVSKASGKSYRETLRDVLTVMAEPSKPQLIALIMLAVMGESFPKFELKKLELSMADFEAYKALYVDAKLGEKGRKSQGEKAIDEV